MGLFDLFSEKGKLKRKVRHAEDRELEVQMRGVPEAAAEHGKSLVSLGRHYAEKGEPRADAEVYGKASKKYLFAAKEARGMEVTRKMADGFRDRGVAMKDRASGLSKLAG